MDMAFAREMQGVNAEVGGKKPMDKLRSAMEALRHAKKEAQELADRLCGSEPRPVDPTKHPSKGETSYFGALEQLAVEIEAVAIALGSEAARIRRHL